MQTQITARHFDADPALRQRVTDRLARLERYYDGITDVHVVLEEGGSPAAAKRAEVTLSVYRQRLSARNEASTYETAVEQCVERLRRQILRYKAKLRDTSKDTHR